MNNRFKAIVFLLYQVGSLLTFVRLTLFDGYTYTWWNWIIAVPINAVLGEIWPLYWLVLRPIFG